MDFLGWLSPVTGGREQLIILGRPYDFLHDLHATQRLVLGTVTVQRVDRLDRPDVRWDFHFRSFATSNPAEKMVLGKNFKIYHKPADPQRPFSLIVEAARGPGQNEALYFESGSDHHPQ